MQEADVQALFLHFAQPLAPLASAGGNRESLNVLAHNLWAAMLGGDQAEQTLWNALREDESVDASIIGLVQLCYENEMKPAVSQDELQALRTRYGITEPPSGDEE